MLKTCELCGKDFRGEPKRRFCSTTCSARFSAGPRRKYFTAEDLREARRGWRKTWWAKNKERYAGRIFPERPEKKQMYELRREARREAEDRGIDPLKLYKAWGCLLRKDLVASGPSGMTNDTDRQSDKRANP